MLLGEWIAASILNWIHSGFSDDEEGTDAVIIDPAQVLRILVNLSGFGRQLSLR
jgi:hypothetical protein